MSDTPRTDAERRKPENSGRISDLIDADFARQLERQLNAANAKIAELEQRLETLNPSDSDPYDQA